VKPEVKSEKITMDAIYNFLGFSNKDIELMKKAAKALQISEEEIMRSGAIGKANKIATQAPKVNALDSENARRNSTLIGAGYPTIRDFLDKVVCLNHRSKNNDTRIFINASVIRNETGCNFNSIKTVLANYLTNDEFSESIDRHNQRYNLDKSANRKGRDELGNRISISDLIAKAEQQKQQPAMSKNPTYQEFAAYIDSLEDEKIVVSSCQDLVNNLRKLLTKETPKQSASALHNDLQKYREEIKKLRLKPTLSYAHVYGTPRTLKPGEPLPKTAKLNDAGKIESIGQHLALKYLVLAKEENDLRK
ncbi:MAG: hypothetical protein ACLBM6_21130, partial [Cuspidothrix sp.]